MLAPNHPEWGSGGFVRHHVSKPIVCAIEGPACGGAEIALTSDLVVASEEATLGLPEVTRGIMAAAGGAFRLPSQVPRKLAPLADQATKRVVQQIVRGRIATEVEAWNASDAEAAALRVTKDAREDAAALIEKRAPRWTGS